MPIAMTRYGFQLRKELLRLPSVHRHPPHPVSFLTLGVAQKTPVIRGKDFKPALPGYLLRRATGRRHTPDLDPSAAIGTEIDRLAIAGPRRNEVGRPWAGEPSGFAAAMRVDYKNTAGASGWPGVEGDLLPVRGPRRAPRHPITRAKASQLPGIRAVAPTDPNLCAAFRSRGREGNARPVR